MYKLIDPDIGEEEKELVNEALKQNWLGGKGPFTKQFEEKLRQITKAKFALALNNGTSALTCALQTLREKYDLMDYICPTFTFYATGATLYEINLSKIPLFRDCNRKTWTIETAEEIKPHDGIMTVMDTCGVPVDYDTIKNETPNILADSAQSFGSEYKNNPIGTQALIHTLSFHTGKIVTTGEGGALLTNDEELYEVANTISNQGYSKDRSKFDYEHSIIGFNYRMPELSSAIGIAQLNKLPMYLKKKKSLAKVYKDILGNLVEYQTIPKNSKSNHSIFGILINKPVKEVCIELYKQKVEAKSLFKPLHKQPLFDLQETYPNAEHLYEHGLMLPINNKLTEEDIKVIAGKLKEILMRK